MDKIVQFKFFKKKKTIRHFDENIENIVTSLMRLCNSHLESKKLAVLAFNFGDRNPFVRLQTDLFSEGKKKGIKIT